ncbi:MAG: DUF2868 domain-containing protein [Thermoguttaceae bacterium]
MKERKTRQTKATIYDWLMIQWARACEENRLFRAPKTKDVSSERDSEGRFVDPTSFLSSRAESGLYSIGISARAWVERAGWICRGSFFFTIALGALAFPFARVETILENGVNLAGPFLFFLVTQLFFLSCASVFLGILLISLLCRRLFGRGRSATWGERVAVLLSGLVGRVAIWVFHHVIPMTSSFYGARFRERFGWHKHSGAARRARLDDPESVKREEEDGRRLREGGALFWNMLFSRAQVAGRWSCVLTHSFWASCSLCVLVILAARMQGNRYDYCWHTSLEDERVVKAGVDFLGAPIAALGGGVPSSADVEALFSDDLNASKNKVGVGTKKTTVDESAAMRQTAAATRSRWSYFLLSLVFIWCVVPRVLFALLYYYLFKKALNDYCPDFQAPYFQEILTKAEGYSTTTLAAERKDDAVLAAIQGVEEEKAPITEPSRPIWKTPPKNEEAVAPIKAESAPVSDNSPASIEEEKTEPELPKELPQVPSVEPQKEDSAFTPAFIPEPATLPASDNGDGTTSVLTEISDDSKEEAEEDDLPEAPSEPVPCDENETAPLVTNVDLQEETEESASNDVCEESADVAETSPSVDNLRQEKSQSRLQSALVKLSVSFAAPENEPSKLAFSYDSTISPELFGKILHCRDSSRLFGDIASEPALKRRLKALLDSAGAEIDLCVIGVDVGLSPARHFIRFLRDDLFPKLTAARIVLVASGGERMRKRFATSPSAISQRLEDWTKTIAAIKEMSGRDIEPVFSYDAELDLPEERRRLEGILEGAERTSAADGKRTLEKWDAATERIENACCEIFAEEDEEVLSEESARLRASVLCAEIFSIYREETGHTARLLPKVDVDGGTLWKSLSEGARNISSEAGKSFASQAEKLGLSPDDLGERLLYACRLGDRFRYFTGKLSPKCGIAAATLGVAAPCVVALSPLLGGAVTATTLLSSLGALGGVLPTSLASGMVTGVLGSMAPEALRQVGCKIAAKFRANGTETGGETPEELLEETSTEFVSALTRAATAWSVVLELQGFDEAQIAERTARIMEPLESSSLSTLEEIKSAISAAREILLATPKA